MCDVCGRDGPTEVRASPFGPMSLAYCVDCLQNFREPEWCLEYLYSLVGTKGEGLDENQLIYTGTWKDGEHWSWERWKAWRRQPEQAHLDEKAEKEIEEMNNATN